MLSSDEIKCNEAENGQTIIGEFGERIIEEVSETKEIIYNLIIFTDILSIIIIIITIVSMCETNQTIPIFTQIKLKRT